jgi:hypothetical protein
LFFSLSFLLTFPSLSFPSPFITNVTMHLLQLYFAF